MNIAKYQIEILTTWRNDETWSDQFVNASLGLAEFQELQAETDLTKKYDELGDLTYYVVMLCNLFNLPAQDYLASYEIDCVYDLDEIVNNIFLIQAIAKKVRFHKKEIDAQKKDDLQFAIEYLFHFILDRNDRWFGFSIEKLFKHNIDKLKKRHGDKFKENTN